MSKHK